MKGYRELLERARDRLNDMLRGDDGHAWKEAQRFVDGLDAAMGEGEQVMNEQDKAAFDEWWTTANVRLTDIPKAQAVYIYESMLAHRDKQAAQAEPVAFDYPDFHAQGMGCGLEDRGITDRYEAMRYGWIEAIESVAKMIQDLGPLYTHPPAEVVRELVGALKNSRSEIWRLLDGKGIDPKDASRWPEIVWADRAIAAAEATKGGV